MQDSVTEESMGVIALLTLSLNSPPNFCGEEMRWWLRMPCRRDNAMDADLHFCTVPRG